MLLNQNKTHHFEKTTFSDVPSIYLLHSFIATQAKQLWYKIQATLKVNFSLLDHTDFKLILHIRYKLFFFSSEEHNEIFR